eukprot:6211032-Pleurochrysis_carterae.AAC.2
MISRFFRINLKHTVCLILGGHIRRCKFARRGSAADRRHRQRSAQRHPGAKIAPSDAASAHSLCALAYSRREKAIGSLHRSLVRA